jgi:nucleoid DNA-binding protein
MKKTNDIVGVSGLISSFLAKKNSKSALLIEEIGSFFLKRYEGYVGCNPITGETGSVPEMMVPVFKADPRLLLKLNPKLKKSDLGEEDNIGLRTIKVEFPDLLKDGLTLVMQMSGEGDPNGFSSAFIKKRDLKKANPDVYFICYPYEKNP